MARKKLKAKLKTVIAPRPKGKPIRPEGGDAGFLSAKIITVVKKKENESKGTKRTEKA